MTTLDLESAATLLGISPSTLQARHTWASWHVQAGTPLAVLKTLGGWSSMDMVMRYSHLAPEHVSEWANNAEPVTKNVTACGLA